MRGSMTSLHLLDFYMNKSYNKEKISITSVLTQVLSTLSGEEISQYQQGQNRYGYLVSGLYKFASSLTLALRLDARGMSEYILTHQ